MAEQVLKPSRLVGGKWLWCVPVALIAILAAWYFRAQIGGIFEKAGSATFTTPAGPTTDITGGPPVRVFPESTKPVVRFNGASSVVIDLQTHEWSRQVVTPTHPTGVVDYRIDVDPPNGFFIKFEDGFIDEVTSGQSKVTDWSMRRGIFRILGKSPNQKATVTIFKST